MKLFYSLLFVCLIHSLQAQSVFTFEEADIEQDSFLNGSDGSGGFSFANFFFPNDYNTEFMSWSGWALTNDTDNTTPGFSNQYASIAGSGNDDSENYATTFVSGSSTIICDLPFPESLQGIYVNNSTYTYLSMLEGDAFAKKFGGETGDDPDFFLLTIKNKNKTGGLVDSVNFYLADYRFEDNSMDYIINEWTYVDLTGFLPIPVDELEFTLSSSDVGQFGMNTPAYFCIDDILTDFQTSNDEIKNDEPLVISPNPTPDGLKLQSDHALDQVEIYNLQGIKLNTIVGNDIQYVDVSELSPGSYFLKTSLNQIKRFIKL